LYSLDVSAKPPMAKTTAIEKATASSESMTLARTLAQKPIYSNSSVDLSSFMACAGAQTLD